VNQTRLDTVEIEPPGTAEASVIWLHGLGASGHDFEGIVPLLPLPSSHGVRFVFPHAPAIPVTLNQGMIMRAWYDISEINLRRGHDLEGVRRSCKLVRRLIEREVERGIEASRIVLAGFSQGGAIALHLGLRHPHALAGIMGLSTYLVEEESLAEEAADANRTTSIFLAHGSFDPMVPFEKGERARDRLQEMGYPVEWHSYPMQHEVCPAEIDDIGAWLEGVLA